MMEKRKGKFIVFEGLDGSGKSTQANLLSQYLKKKGEQVAQIDFPQYGKKSAGLIEEYLNGKYGPAKEVGAKRASVFYACDRYDASFKIREWLRNGVIVIADRYTASNIGHQGGKIKDRQERSKYFKWLYNLEYNFFKIPKPDITFILKTNPEIALKMAGKTKDEAKLLKRQLYLVDKDQDIHEQDVSHQKQALASYLQAAKEYPDEYIVIECLKQDELRGIKEIHQEIVGYVRVLFPVTG